MENGLRRKINSHIFRHFVCNEMNYIYFAVAIAAGVCSGAFTAACLDSSLKAEMTVIFENYRTALRSGGLILSADIVYDNILSNIKVVFFLTVCGLSSLAPVSGILALAVKGFAAGFFTASAFACLELKAALPLLLLSLPYQIISVFCLLAAAGVSAAHREMHEKTPVYLMQMFLIFLLMIIAALVDILIKKLC